MTGLPLASTYASIMHHGSGTFAWRLVGRAIASVLKPYGCPTLTPDELYFDPAVLKIIP